MHAKLSVIGAGDITSFLALQSRRPHQAKIDAEGLIADMHVNEMLGAKLALDALAFDEETRVIANALKRLLRLGHESDGVVHGRGGLDLRLGRALRWWALGWGALQRIRAARQRRRHQ